MNIAQVCLWGHPDENALYCKRTCIASYWPIKRKHSPAFSCGQRICILSEMMTPSPHPSTVYCLFACKLYAHAPILLLRFWWIPSATYRRCRGRWRKKDCFGTCGLSLRARPHGNALLCKHTCFAYRPHGSCKRSAWKCTFLKLGLGVKKYENAALTFSCGRWIHILGVTPLPRPSTTSLQPLNPATCHNNNNNNGRLHACVGVSCNLLAL